MSLKIEQLEPMLRINKHRLDDELELQPQLSHDISESVATANAKMLSLKEDLAKEHATIGLELRSGGEKMTVDAINAEITIDPEYQSISLKYQAAKKDYERWLGMAEAWRARGFALKTLADLYIASYYVIDSAGSEATYRENRRELSKAREATTPVRRRVVV